MIFSRVRRTTVALLLLLTLALGVANVSAQDDLDVLNEALFNTGAANSANFDFDLDFSLSGVPGAATGAANTASVSGVGTLSAGGLDMSLDGIATIDDEATPFALWLRLVDGVLYFSQDGEVWTGTDLDELGPIAEQLIISNYRTGFAGSAGTPGSTLSDDDPAVQEAVGSLMGSLATFDPTGFVTTTQLDEDTGLPVAHFVTTLDLPGLMQSDAVLNLIVALVQIGDPTITSSMSQADLAAVGSMVGDVFNQTSIQVDTYVNLDTDFVEQMTLDVQMTIDPSAVETTTGQPIVASLTLDMHLYDYNIAPEVVAPAGAMVMSNVAGMLGLDVPQQPLPTAIPPMTPTPTLAAPTQATQQISAGMPTTVTIGASGAVDVVYQGTAGETITVSVSSSVPGALDTTLEVVSPSGEVLASNDDHSSSMAGLGTLDSAVEDLVLPTDGLYNIHASTFSGSSQGDVVITVTGASAQPAPTLPPTEAPVVSGGDTITGNTPQPVTLSASGPADLTYTGAAGETITVIARSLEESGTIDTTLEVLSPAGIRLAFNDDHGSDLPDLAPFDSAIQDLVLPDAGDYTVRVTTFTGAGEGNVEVTVLSDMAPAPQPTISPTESGPAATATPVDVILTGETDTVSGVVPAGSSFTYNFNGRPNQVTTITVIAGTPGDLDPKVALIGPDGAVLAENDDHTDADPELSNLDSRISDFVLPTEGRYSVVVSGFANTSGPFDLTIRRAVEGGESIVTPVAPVETPVAGSDEQVIDGEVRSGETFTYDLQANAGDVYTIVVRGDGDFDSRIIVSDPEGFVVAENDDHGSGDPTLDTFDSKIDSLIVQESGTYTIEVTDYSGDRGTFELGITLVMTGAPIGPGEDSVSLGEIEEGDTFTTTVDLTAGDFVTISIRTVSGDLDPQVTLIDPSGSIVAENDDHADIDPTLGRYDSRIPRMPVTTTGAYTIEVTGYSGSGTFTVTVNTLSGN